MFKRKSADKSVSQPGCSHSNMIYDAQLQKTIMLCTQPRSPSNLDAAITMRSAPPMAHPHVSTHMATEHCNIHAAIALRSATADCKRPYNCAQANRPHGAKHPVGTCRNQSHVKTSVAAPAAHTITSPIHFVCFVV